MSLILLQACRDVNEVAGRELRVRLDELGHPPHDGVGDRQDRSKQVQGVSGDRSALLRSPKCHEAMEDLLYDLDRNDRVQLAISNSGEDSLARLLQLVVGARGVHDDGRVDEDRHRRPEPSGSGPSAPRSISAFMTSQSATGAFWANSDWIASCRGRARGGVYASTASRMTAPRIDLAGRDPLKSLPLRRRQQDLGPFRVHVQVIPCAGPAVPALRRCSQEVVRWSSRSWS
jgi:hypothetical protein